MDNAISTGVIVRDIEDRDDVLLVLDRDVRWDDDFDEPGKTIWWMLRLKDRQRVWIWECLLEDPRVYEVIG